MLLGEASFWFEGSKGRDSKTFRIAFFVAFLRQIAFAAQLHTKIKFPCIVVLGEGVQDLEKKLHRSQKWIGRDKKVS